MDDLKEMCLTFGGLIGTLMGIIGVVIVIVATFNYFVDRSACKSYEELSGLKTFYSAGTSCIVNYNGDWVDYAVATKAKQEITLKQK